MTNISSKKHKRVATAALTSFFRICEKWSLEPEEQRALLGNPDDSTFNRWQTYKTAVDLSQDTLERISYILGIYKALHILLPSRNSADSWVKKPNNAKLFSGDSALDYMISGEIENLAAVRRYLDGQKV